MAAWWSPWRRAARPAAKAASADDGEGGEALRTALETALLVSANVRESGGDDDTEWPPGLARTRHGEAACARGGDTASAMTLILSLLAHPGGGFLYQRFRFF
jgi:hypothetical protein